MKKRLTAGVCLLAALALLLVPWTMAAGAYDGVYLVGINDTVLLGLISQDQMPVRRSGVIFAPCTILGNQDLGLSYAINRTGGTFTVYNREHTLIFQLDGTGSADKEGNTYTNHIITRNGVVYIPLRFVCSVFGLTYSFYNLVLPDGTVPIARVCTPTAILTDQQFGASAAQMAETPLRQYLAATQSPASPTPTAGASPSAPLPSASPSGPVELSFAVVCNYGEGFRATMDSFARAGVSALYLFPVDALAERDRDIRAAAAAGHQIGLLLPSEDPHGAFAEGNRLLSHILHTQVTQVAFQDPGAAVESDDWWVWQGNVAPRGRGVSAQTSHLKEDVDERSVARVTLNDSRTTAQAFSRNISAWSRRPYRLSTPTESTR